MTADDLGQGVRSILERQPARLGPRPLLVLPDATLSYAETDEVAEPQLS